MTDEPTGKQPKPASDAAVPFGHSMAWYAVKSEDTKRIAEILGLTDLEEATWRAGLAAVEGDLQRADEEMQLNPALKRVFITPNVDGWTLVVGWWAMSHLDRVGFMQMQETCARLSAELGQAQNFGCEHSDCNYRQWVLAREGVVLRAFEQLDDEACIDVGPPTPEETHLLGKRAVKTDSESVLSLAGAWSVNPQQLGPETRFTGTGFIASTPYAAGTEDKWFTSLQRALLAQRRSKHKTP